MNQVACPKCGSGNVTVVDSRELEGWVSIYCLACNETSRIAGENFEVETDDLPPE